MKTLLAAALVALTATSALAHGDGTLYQGHGHGHDHTLGHHHDGHTHHQPVPVYRAPPPVVVCNYYTESHRRGPEIWYYTRDCYGNVVNTWAEYAPVYYYQHRY